MATPLTIDHDCEMGPYGWVFTFWMEYPSSDLMTALGPHTTGKSNYKKAKATKQMRALALAAAIPAVRGERWERAVIMYKFYKKDRGTLDESNMIQRCKPMVDGIVDSGLIKDDCNKYLSIGPVYSGVDKENPRIEIILQKLQVW